MDPRCIDEYPLVIDNETYPGRRNAFCFVCFNMIDAWMPLVG